MVKRVAGIDLRYYAPVDEEFIPVTEEQRTREAESRATWRAYWFGPGKARRTATARPADTTPLKDPDLARRIRIARKFAGFTTANACAALGIGPTALRSYERARSSVPAMVLWRMAVLYRRDMAWFFLEAETRFDPYEEGAVQLADEDDAAWEE